nr:hypothetical protein [Rhizobium sp. WYCCWR 11146]
MGAFSSPTDRSSPGSDPHDRAPSLRLSTLRNVLDGSYGHLSAGFLQLETVVPKPELLTWCGCLLIFQLLGAASASGYIITALFLLVALGRFTRNILDRLTARLPKRSALKHYTTAIVSLVFFCLLVVRMCFIATVIIDSAIQGDHVEVSGDLERQF